MLMLKDFLNLFFPFSCLTCDHCLAQGELWICANCLQALPHTDYHQYPNNEVAQRLYGRLPIVHAMALYHFNKTNRTKQLIYALKYKGQPEVGAFVGRKYGAILKSTPCGPTFDLIVPVPLHQDRLRQRGYNQSAHFAKGLAEVLTTPWNGQCLQRIKNTTTQTRRDKLDRITNVAKAFLTTDVQAVKGKHVLLVDDVITTGATLEASGGALLEAGVKALSVATIAVAG